MKLQKIHLSIGSNIGDKFKNLQAAVDAIFKTIGTVKTISKVFKTEAIGLRPKLFTTPA